MLQLLLGGCRRGEVDVVIRQLPPQERALYREISPYLQRIEHNPQDVSAYIEALRRLYRRGHTQVALLLLDEGLANNPEQPELVLERGRISESLLRYSQALEDYRQVLSRVPTDVDALRGAARCSWQLGEHDEASRLLATARALAPYSADIMLDEAAFAYTSRDYQEALELCRNAQKLAPQRADAYYNAALALLALNRPQEALEEVKRALLLAPDAVEAKALYAEAALALGMTAEATAAAREAMELNPAFEAPYRTLGNIALAQGEEEAAIDCFRRATELNPRDIMSLNKLLALSEKRNDGELELYSLRRLSRAIPSDTGLRQRLAESAMRQRQFTEAAAEYRMLAEKQPAAPEYLRGLGRVYEHFEDWEGIIEAYRPLAQAGTATAREQLALANALIEMEGVAEAEQLLLALSGSIPADDPGLLRLTGALLLRKGQAAEALGYLEHAAELGDTEAAWKAAITAASRNDFEAAEALLDRLLASAPERADILRVLAEVKSRLGRSEEAAGLYSSLLLYDPGDLQAQQYMCRYRLERGDREKAQEAAEALLRQSPGNPHAKYVLGSLLAEQGRYAEALRYLTEASELLGPSPELAKRLDGLRGRLQQTASTRDLWARYRRTRDRSLLWTIARIEAGSEAPLRALRPLNMLANDLVARRRALEEISSLYTLTNRQSDAIRTSRQLAREYDDAAAWASLAETLAHFALFDQSLEAIGRALKHKPSLAPALRLAAQMHLARGEPEKALNYYLTLHELDLSDTGTLLAICRTCAFHLNDQQRTRAFYQKLLKAGGDANEIEKYLAEAPPPAIHTFEPLPVATEPAPAPEAEYKLSPAHFGPDTSPAAASTAQGSE